MCLAKVYAGAVGAEPVLESVARIKLDGERVQMETLFGEEKVITGRVVEIDFAGSRVIVDVHDSSAKRGKANSRKS